MKRTTQTELVIFTHGRQKVKLKGDFDSETLWASQADMARIFDVTPQNITLHLRNIYKEKELTFEATCKEILQVQKEGNREVSRRVRHYNLDVMIAVGYRVSSIVGTSFRQWATKTLREHITKGYTINPSRIEANYNQFMEAVETLKKLAPAQSRVDTESVLELVRLFADTWFALDAYDKEALVPKKVTKRNVALTTKLLLEGVAVLKTELMSKGEARNFLT